MLNSYFVEMGKIYVFEDEKAIYRGLNFRTFYLRNENKRGKSKSQFLNNLLGRKLFIRFGVVVNVNYPLRPLVILKLISGNKSIGCYIFTSRNLFKYYYFI